MTQSTYAVWADGAPDINQTSLVASREKPMFEQLTPVPPDPILGLTEAFLKDPNPHKVNLGAGVYKDAQGRVPILTSVRAAEERLLHNPVGRTYLPIAGLPTFITLARELLLGAAHPVVQAQRAVTVQAPGGTGALRVAADFLRRVRPEAVIWVSDPTWPNHPNIFRAAGFRVATYPYFDIRTLGVDGRALVEALQHVPAGDVVLLHGCCHNPTGADPDEDIWEEIAHLAETRGWLPLVDFAYQGFGRGLDIDAGPVRRLAERVPELLVATSFSKNFSLYSERVGALTLIAAQPEHAGVALGHLKKVIRSNYSNPPSHGARVVATILGDASLRSLWEEELKGMRQRILSMRRRFVQALEAAKAPRDFSFLLHQKGMFSYTGLSPAEVDRLKERFSIYMVRSGRINVAGLTEENVEYVAQAIAQVLRASS